MAMVGDPLAALEALYSFHGGFVRELSAACRPGCAACCTANVTLTSLEGRYLLQAWSGDEGRRLSSLLDEALRSPRYRPRFTINEVAAFCIEAREVPQDDGVHGPGRCIFLGQDQLCGVYGHRPFACRAMISRVACRPAGSADMEPFLVTVNLAFHQIIEHLDRDGVSGNLSDVLSALMARGDDCPKEGCPALRNRACPGLLVPPWDKGRFGALFRRLCRQPVGNGRLGDWLDDLTGSDRGSP